MEKNSFLPLKFYPELSWTDYEKYIKNCSQDIVIPREHNLYAPPFQFILPDKGKHWSYHDFMPLGLSIVSYTGDVVGATGTEENLSGWFMKFPQVYSRAGHYRALVNFRFPLIHGVPSKLQEGLYYYRLTDGDDNWYSEVFELCDFELDAMTEAFDNEAGWAGWSSTYSASDELCLTQFCKTATGAGDATAYMDLEVFLGEELDIYIQTDNYNLGGCGATDWNAPIYIELRDASGAPMSERLTIDTNNTEYTFSLEAEMGGTVRLYMWMDDADTGKGWFYLFVQRRYTPKHTQIRWKNSVNFCKIFYEDDYENVFFFDTKQVIDQNQIDENVVEDDETNKYRLIGTNQKWNSIQLASGEAILNAMSLMRLHDNVKFILETGEPVDIVELLVEQSISDYELAIIKLIYREESCSIESCGFELCCPTPGTPTMMNVYAGVGSLPAAGAGNNGWYAMVWTAGDQYRIYYSNGAAWNVDTTYDIDGYCVEARQNNSGTRTRFHWYDTGVSRWRKFIDLASVTDNADGTATLNTDTEYYDGVTGVAEYEDANGVWHECGTPVLLTGGGAIGLNCNCGVGTWDFRIHIYTSDCDYGYSNVVNQAIT